MGNSDVRNFIHGRFQVQDGHNYFDFPYDWRRDNRVAAKRLARLSREWLDTWKRESGHQDAKLILIGHSMGGLVARYFLEVFEGWEITRYLITFGTPYRGSLNALNFISSGLQKKLGPITLVDLSTFLRSCTSVYQLLPTYECYDDGKGKLVRIGETSDIPNVDSSKAANALKFHDEIRVAVEAHVSDKQYKNDGYLIYPIVGTNQPTFQSSASRKGNREDV